MSEINQRRLFSRDRVDRTLVLRQPDPKKRAAEIVARWIVFGPTIIRISGQGQSQRATATGRIRPEITPAIYAAELFPALGTQTIAQIAFSAARAASLSSLNAYQILDLLALCECWDFRTRAMQFQDSGGTIPITADGQSVAQVKPIAGSNTFTLNPAFSPPLSNATTGLNYTDNTAALDLAVRRTDIKTVFAVFDRRYPNPGDLNFWLGDSTAYDFHPASGPSGDDAALEFGQYTSPSVMGGTVCINNVSQSPAAVPSLVDLTLISINAITPLTFNSIAQSQGLGGPPNNRGFYGDYRFLAVSAEDFSADETFAFNEFALEYSAIPAQISGAVVAFPSTGTGTVRQYRAIFGSHASRRATGTGLISIPSRITGFHGAQRATASGAITVVCQASGVAGCESATGTGTANGSNQTTGTATSGPATSTGTIQQARTIAGSVFAKGAIALGTLSNPVGIRGSSVAQRSSGAGIVATISQLISGGNSAERALSTGLLGTVTRLGGPSSAQSATGTGNAAQFPSIGSISVARTATHLGSIRQPSHLQGVSNSSPAISSGSLAIAQQISGAHTAQAAMGEATTSGTAHLSGAHQASPTVGSGYAHPVLGGTLGAIATRATGAAAALPIVQILLSTQGQEATSAGAINCKNEISGNPQARPASHTGDIHLTTAIHGAGFSQKATGSATASQIRVVRKETSARPAISAGFIQITGSYSAGGIAQAGPASHQGRVWQSNPIGGSSQCDRSTGTGRLTPWRRIQGDHQAQNAIGGGGTSGFVFVWGAVNSGRATGWGFIHVEPLSAHPEALKIFCYKATFGLKIRTARYSQVVRSAKFTGCRCIEFTKAR